MTIQSVEGSLKGYQETLYQVTLVSSQVWTLSLEAPCVADGLVCSHAEANMQVAAERSLIQLPSPTLRLIKGL